MPLTEGPDFLPVHTAAANYFRTRRYIGSKDRRSIQGTLYDILHGWQDLAAKLGQSGASVTPRNLIIAHLAETKALDEALFDGGQYGLTPLTKDEQALAEKIAVEEPPAWAAANCPEWLFEKLQSRFGDDTGRQLTALNERAPFAVRANTLRKDPEEALKGLGFSKGRLAPGAWISADPVPIQNHAIFREGRVEVQDEGSQLAAHLAGAGQGMQVLDLCAGAGGKTLALAAAMENTGQIYAFDVDEKKVRHLKDRLTRAGARNIQPGVIQADGKARNGLLYPLKGKMDRVLLDVPCSGTGVWRRHPDSRLRLTPEKLEDYKAAQKALLGEGAALARPGGRVVYVTCSLLKEENEDQTEAFLKENPGWRLVSPEEGPESAGSLDGTLLLTPADHGTDGFFVAILEKP